MKKTALTVVAIILAGATFAEPGSVVISGALKQWHKVTLTLDGPFARETYSNPTLSPT